jgi:sarcosine oxidase subunit beta
VTGRDPETDVLVVGAGIIGSAVAYRLAEQGWDVTVADALGQPGHGSTSASSAIIRFHYESLDSAAMAWDSYGAWLDWESELGGADPAGMPVFTPTGALMLGSPQSFATIIANFEQLGIGYDVLSSDEISRRWPQLETAAFGPPCRPEDARFWQEPSGERVTGLYTESGGYVADPQRAAASYAWAARERGASFRHRSRLVALDLSSVAMAEFADGTGVRARAVVNAAGPASREVSLMAGLTDDTCRLGRALLTETHALPAPAGFRGPDSVLVLDTDLGIAIRPDGDADLHVSSLEPDCDPLEWTDDPWSYDERPSQAAYELQAMRAARRLPDLTIPHKARGLTALYDVSPDWIPLIGATPARGFFMACGTSGNSFKTAPTIAGITATIVGDFLRTGAVDRSPLRLDRAGYLVSADAFSPVREPRVTRNVLA